MMSPGSMNIRRTSRSASQRARFAIPNIWTGDYLAVRPSGGFGPRIVANRQPWEAGPYAWLPAARPPAAMGLFDELLGAVQERTTQSVTEAIRPYLIWGVLGVGLAAGLGFFVGFETGRRVTP